MSRSERYRWHPSVRILRELGGECWVSGRWQFWTHHRLRSLDERRRGMAGAQVVTALAGRPPGVVRAFGHFFVRDPRLPRAVPC